MSLGSPLFLCSLCSNQFQNKIDNIKFETNKTKQLKDYENAVLAKRLEELDDDELLALQEEVERDTF